MAVVNIRKDQSGSILVSFPYNLLFIEKVKAIDGRRWHPAEKHWSFPNTEGVLEKILKVFGDEEVLIDPAFQNSMPDLSVGHNPTLAKGGEGGFSDKSPDHASQRTPHNFEDLRRELVSRKYSYKTVKGYIYYNRDFIDFTDKHPSEVNDDDIKDYLLYLAEEKESATATINQAINALKFYPALLQKCGVYYGAMLKRKFLYEIKRPRKDKKLPEVLSKEEVSHILNGTANIKHKAILMTIYSSGLRLGETARLEQAHLDRDRMLIFVKGAKGRKDRYTPHFDL